MFFRVTVYTGPKKNQYALVGYFSAKDEETVWEHLLNGKDVYGLRGKAKEDIHVNELRYQALSAGMIP
jgi:hypothetical protein